MLNEINERLHKLKEELVLKSVLEEKRERLWKQLSLEEEILEELRGILNKEHKDVEKLEKLSFSSLFATVMKNKYEKLEKEQHEYLMAKIKYDQQNSKVESIKENVFSVQDRIKSLKECEKEYKELLDKKLEIIKTSGNSNIKIKLSDLDEELSKALRAYKEIEEAEIVGRSLVENIAAAIDSLESAEILGVWDIAGGGFFTSMAKLDSLDEAESYFIGISNLLQRFNKELGDVNIASLSFSSTDVVFEALFDNIFTDLSVQSQISDSLSEISYLSERVNEIMYSLGQERESLSSSIATKRKEYEEFIETL